MSRLAFSRALIKWYRAHRRELPWRKMGIDGRPDSYHVLLSEIMLQQTQVATVIPYFHRFLDHFPTLQHLAEADEQEVLRNWQGLGYYSRARNLHRAARAIVSQYAAQVPNNVQELMKLPGIGRYTAGAIASLAYDQPAPIVDGNVCRILCRLDGIAEDPRSPAVSRRLWARAAELIPASAAGDFNSAMMELGATLCTPRNPRCDECPVARWCTARRNGNQHELPRPKQAIERPLERRWVFCIESDGQWLIEQRPPKGRWASLWQFVTVPAQSASLTSQQAARLCDMEIELLAPMTVIRHDLTHRRYEFLPWRCRSSRAHGGEKRTWTRLSHLDRYPLPRPHLLIARALEESC